MITNDNLHASQQQPHPPKHPKHPKQPKPQHVPQHVPQDEQDAIEQQNSQTHQSIEQQSCFIVCK